MPDPSLRIWLLLGDKAGDNAQLRAIAAAVRAAAGGETLEFPLVYARRRRGPGRWRKPGFEDLADEGAELRAALAATPPDLVLASGRRSVPVARALRARATSRPRLVQVGRPRAPLDWFDLVITTPQYGLPPHPRVLLRALPVAGGSAAERRAAGHAWRDRLAGSRPFHAVLVGGDVDPWRHDDAAMTRLADGLLELAGREDVDLAITCGRRLPRASAEVLRVLLADSGRLRHFHVFDGDREANPYLALLELAAGFVVTADSVSMLAEAVATGRPVRVFRPARAPSLAFRLAAAALALPRSLLPRRLHDRLVAEAWIVPQRRSERVLDHLLAERRIGELGQGPAAAGGSAASSVEDDIVPRIISMFDEGER